MASNISKVSVDSVDSTVFFVEQLSNEPCAQRNNYPNFLNSTEPSGTHTRELARNSTCPSPEPDIVILDDDSNDMYFRKTLGHNN